MSSSPAALEWALRMPDAPLPPLPPTASETGPAEDADGAVLPFKWKATVILLLCLVIVASCMQVGCNRKLFGSVADESYRLSDGLFEASKGRPESPVIARAAMFLRRLPKGAIATATFSSVLSYGVIALSLVCIVVLAVDGNDQRIRAIWRAFILAVVAVSAMAYVITELPVPVWIGGLAAKTIAFIHALRRRDAARWPSLVFCVVAGVDVVAVVGALFYLREPVSTLIILCAALLLRTFSTLPVPPAESEGGRSGAALMRQFWLGGDSWIRWVHQVCVTPALAQTP